MISIELDGVVTSEKCFLLNVKEIPECKTFWKQKNPFWEKHLFWFLLTSSPPVANSKKKITQMHEFYFMKNVNLKPQS